MNIAKHYTTIVVGCGPAGIMSARYAAVRGPVLLIDQMKLPREKSCGGMLNEYAQEFIRDQLKSPIPKDIVSEPAWINFRFFDWDRDMRKPTTLRFANVERKGFDDWLMGFLPDNVDVQDRTRLVYLTQTRDRVVVQLRDADDPDGQIQTLECDYLVGADGPMTSVRSFLPVSQLEHYKTIQEYLPLKQPLEPFFDCIYARGIGGDYGYGYLIPKGENAILGSVFFPHSKKVSHLHDKAKFMYSSYYPVELEPVKREAWSAISVRKLSDVVAGHGRVLLAGEAGGLFSPSSGEGISFAMNSGSYAGTAIAIADEAAPGTAAHEGPESGESDALRAYRAALAPIRKNIARRLRLFPIINSDWGKHLGGDVPDFMVDRMAHIM